MQNPGEQSMFTDRSHLHPFLLRPNDSNSSCSVKSSWTLPGIKRGSQTQTNSYEIKNTYMDETSSSFQKKSNHWHFCDTWASFLEYSTGEMWSLWVIEVCKDHNNIFIPFNCNHYQNIIFNLHICFFTCIYFHCVLNAISFFPRKARTSKYSKIC